MNKIAKKISAIVMAGLMATSLVVSASAECGHATWSASVRPPYYERVTSHHRHKIGEYEEGGIIHELKKECDIYTKYGQLYQVCANCGKTMSVTETSMGTRHSVTT